MPNTPALTIDQRAQLAELLQARLSGFKQDRVSQLHGLTQAQSAHQTLLQDADDATQRAGAHEVEAIVSDIDSAEFNAVRHALDRLQGAGFGLCADCHARIPFERLQIEPQALRCAACQTAHERSVLP